jgi:hypothetical protein
MGTGCRPIGSLQAGYREGAGCGVKKKREECVVFLLAAGLCSLGRE